MAKLTKLNKYKAVEHPDGSFTIKQQYRQGRGNDFWAVIDHIDSLDQLPAYIDRQVATAVTANNMGRFSTLSPAVRNKIIVLLHWGVTPAKICSFFKVSRKTVYGIRSRYLQQIVN